MVDETTDRVSQKHFVLVVSFLALLEYNKIVTFYNTNDIPYKANMIGFASDGASVMMGCKNSLMTLLKNDIPSLFVMKCICHSLALCVSHANEQLPPELEVTIRVMCEMYAYIKYSAKRLNNFEKFFEEEGKSVPEVKEIWKKLKNPFFLLYLKFLEFVSPLIVDRNKKFQSEKPQIHSLYTEMEGMYCTILEFFIDDRFFNGTPVANINYQNSENYLKLDKIDFGLKVNADISNLGLGAGVDAQRIKSFRTRRSVRSISPLAKYFGSDVVKLNMEYRLFRNTYKDNYKEVPKKVLEESEKQSFVASIIS